LMLVTVFGAFGLGLLAAWWLYLRRPKLPEEMAEKMPGPYALLLHKYYVDELYDAVIVHPMEWISANVLWKTVDAAMIDGTVNGVGRLARDLGQEARQVQSGNGRTYASWLVAGAAAIAILFLWLGH